MNAVISGTRGIALIVREDGVGCIDNDGRRRDATVEDIHRLLHEPGDVSFVECVDLADLRKQLAFAVITRRVRFTWP